MDKRESFGVLTIRLRRVHRSEESADHYREDEQVDHHEHDDHQEENARPPATGAVPLGAVAFGAAQRGHSTVARRRCWDRSMCSGPHRGWGWGGRREALVTSWLGTRVAGAEADFPRRTLGRTPWAARASSRQNAVRDDGRGSALTDTVWPSVSGYLRPREELLDLAGASTDDLSQGTRAGQLAGGGGNGARGWGDRPA